MLFIEEFGHFFNWITVPKRLKVYYSFTKRIYVSYMHKKHVPTKSDSTHAIVDHMKGAFIFRNIINLHGSPSGGGK